LADSAQLAVFALWALSMMKLQPFGFIAISLAVVGIAYSSYAQSPADYVAAQVRNQGYKCDQPTAATQDVRLSKPDLAVWILTCGNAAYRVRLDPDMAARITKLRKKSY
jgi:hypothetical protein